MAAARGRNPGAGLRRRRRPSPTRQPKPFLDNPRILAGRQGNRDVVSLDPPGLEPTRKRPPPESPRPHSGIRRTASARSRTVQPPPVRPRSSSTTRLLCHPSWRSRACRATFNLKFAFSSRMSRDSSGQPWPARSVWVPPAYPWQTESCPAHSVSRHRSSRPCPPVCGWPGGAKPFEHWPVCAQRWLPFVSRARGVWNPCTFGTAPVGVASA